MTDRELLEFAAKAAGIPLAGWWDSFGWARADGEGDPWWPLTEDSDALRLAVKCGIVVEYRRDVAMAFAYHYALNLEVGQRNTEGDAYAATRRAIVRVAAEIGRGIK